MPDAPLHPTPAPTFSVVIPVYDRAATVRRTLASVAAQTFANWECIVVDDGSNDGEALARVVESLGDPRFVLLRQANGGGGAARNAGVDAARGRFVAFLDSDDAFVADKLERVAAIVREHRRVAWFSYVHVDRGRGAWWVRPDRPPRSGEPIAEYLFVAYQIVQTSSIVLPVEVARAVPFDPTLRKGQDLDLVVRLAAAGVDFEMLEAPLAVWSDTTEGDRTSARRHPEAAAAWLERAAPWLSHRARHGYRATVLAFELAPTRPWSAAWHLIDGGLRGRVPPTILARQAMRCFVPRSAYRRLVDAIVRARSRRHTKAVG